MIMNESTDDEVLERFSVDSLEDTSSVALRPSTVDNENPIRSSVPFRLHEESENEREETRLDLGEARKLPWNCEIDESVLMSKGLQLNKDGSFSKSPREEKQDNLPFVMPAPRVALIRRKKKDCMKATDKSQAYVQGDELSRLKARGNLTDSMKEALYMGNRKDMPKEVEGLLMKFKKELSLNGKGKSEVSTRLSRKNRSDLQLPAIEKPVKLSYFERYQKKSGFDPMSITHKAHKQISDTVRSKFGDSGRDTLSEVSSRFTTAEEDEEEEVFYRKIMAEDCFKIGNLESDRTFGERRVEKAVERKKEVKIKSKNSSKASPSGNTLPLRTLGNLSSGRKSSSHCCAADRGPLPKAELVSKARVYGNLANTRNIVKMQLKSFRRDWECPGNNNLDVGKSHGKKESFLPPLKDSKFNTAERSDIL